MNDHRFGKTRKYVSLFLAILSVSVSIFSIPVIAAEKTIEAKLTIDKTNVNIAPGATLQLNVALTLMNGEKVTGETIYWSSSDEKVATVDQNGLVRAHANGSAIIMAKAQTISVSCTVNVMDKPPAVNSVSGSYKYGVLKVIEDQDVEESIMVEEEDYDVEEDYGDDEGDYYDDDDYDDQPTWEGESYEGISENKYFVTKDEPLSTVSIDVDTASYANMRRFLNYGSLPPVDAIRIEELINYFDYDYPQPKGSHPINIISEVSACPWNSEHYIAKIALQGKDLDVKDLPPSNLVFLIDVSGSMDYDNKLPLLIQGLKLLTKNLRTTDKVSIVVYAGHEAVMLEGATGKEKDKIIKVLDSLDAGGSTNGEGGLNMAYQIAQKEYINRGNNRVILCTDGDFNVGLSGANAMTEFIAEKRETGVYLSILGFGMGNLQDSTMKALSVAGNGNYYYIDSLKEAQKVLVSQMSSTLTSIADDVKWQIEWNPATIQQYRLIGYERRIMPNKDFDDDKKDAGEMGVGQSVTILYELVPTGAKPMDGKTTKQLKAPKGSNTKNFCAISVRYKNPGKSTSILIEQTVPKSSFSKKMTQETAFASAVAEMGLLLRDSSYKGKASYSSLIKRAQSNRGNDEEGFRAEFIQLAKLAQELSK